MLGVLYKNIKCSMKSLLLWFGVMVFVNALSLVTLTIPDGSGVDGGAMAALFCMMFTAMTFYVGGMMEDGVPAIDERKKWAFFIASNEDGIKKEVGSKYIYVLLCSMLTVIICTFFNMLLIDISGDESANITAMIILLFYVQLFVRAFSFPFLYAFGSKVGNAVRLMVLMIVVIAVSVYLLFGDLSGFDLDSFYDYVLKLMTDMNESWKLMWIQAVCFMIVPVLYYFSYRISCKLYLRGVENYDK